MASKRKTKDIDPALQRLQEGYRVLILMDRIQAVSKQFEELVKQFRPDALPLFYQFMIQLYSDFESIAQFDDQLENGRMVMSFRRKRKHKRPILIIQLWEPKND